MRAAIKTVSRPIIHPTPRFFDPATTHLYCRCSDAYFSASEPVGEEERGECPLCTYMMNSPCKDVFVVFKACIDKCVR